MAQYDNPLELARPSLGPAAEKFVQRQISGRLDVSPKQITSQHMEELSKWCLLSGKLVMDEAKAQEFSQKVKALKG